MEIEYPPTNTDVSCSNITRGPQVVPNNNKSHIRIDFTHFESLSQEKILAGLSQLECTSNLRSLELNLSRLSMGVNEVQWVCERIRSLKCLTRIDLNLSQNSIGDRGYDAVFASICELQALEELSISMDQCALKTRGIFMLRVVNVLPNLLSFSLSINKNQIEIETELREILPTFKNSSAFSQIKSLSISFDECVSPVVAASSASNANTISNSQSNSIQQALQANIAHYQTLLGYMNQLRANNYPESHVQVQQGMAQLSATQSNIVKLQQAAAAAAATQSNSGVVKKTLLTKMLELMLRFTAALEEFKFSCPGELVTSASLAQFAQLIKIKQSTQQHVQKLKVFEFHACHAVEFEAGSTDADFFFFELGKLSELSHLSLEFANLNTKKPLQLLRFLAPLQKLESIALNLNHLHEFSPISDISADLAGFLAAIAQRALLLKKIHVNLSHSCISDEHVAVLSKAIQSYKGNLIDLSLNFANCKNITRASANALSETFEAQCQLQRASVDLSQNLISYDSIETLIQAIAKSAQSMNSLIVNATMKRRAVDWNNNNNNINQERTANSMTAINTKNVTEALISMDKLKKCILNVGNDRTTLNIMQAFKNQAQQRNRLLKQAQCLFSDAQLSKAFRQGIAANLLEFLMP